MTSLSPWVRRLSAFADLDGRDQSLLESMTLTNLRFTTSDSLARSGEPADRVAVVLQGIGCVFKLLPDGRRQILAYLLPGDMTDPRQLLAPIYDHSACVLWPARVALLGAEAMHRLERYPNIVLAIGRYELVKQAITREWQLNVGNRTAMERVSHLICETYARLKVVGLTNDRSFELPLTQSELGDTLALSSVHVNRTLMELRRQKLLTIQNRQAVIHNHAGLCASAGFDGEYLRIAPLFDAQAAASA